MCLTNAVFTVTCLQFKMYYIQLLLKIRSFFEQEILITLFCIAQGHRKIPVACSPKSAIDYQ